MTNIKVDICTAMLCPDTCSQKTAREDLGSNCSRKEVKVCYCYTEENRAKSVLISTKTVSSMHRKSMNILGLHISKERYGFYTD